MVTQETVLTIPEVAKRLRIGKNSAYKYIRAGTIPSIKLGRRYLIPVKALENWLINQGKAVLTNAQ